jgi:plastocyanin
MLDSHARPRWRVLLLAALVLGSVIDGGKTAAQSAGETRTVLGGATAQLSETAIVEVNHFLPATVRVRVGDTVAWKIEGPHTVTFLGGTLRPHDDFIESGGRTIANPQVFLPSTQGPPPPYDGTGFLNSGFAVPEFAVTFATIGTFGYVCLIHPTMTGQVMVEAAGAAIPAQAELDQAAAAMRDAAVERGRALYAAENKTEIDAGPSGSQRHHIQMDAGVEELDMMAFPRMT